MFSVRCDFNEYYVLCRSTATVTKQIILKNKQKEEDKMGLILIFITILFILCHSPRLILDIHELMNSDNANKCQAAGLDFIPTWVYIFIHISHFCLVLNSTMNFFVYGFMSSLFQQEFKKLFRKILCLKTNDIIII